MRKPNGWIDWWTSEDVFPWAVVVGISLVFILSVVVF